MKVKLKTKTVLLVAASLAVLTGGVAYVVAYDNDYSGGGGYSVTETENRDGHNHEHESYGVK